ncbi:hypothetical protein [Oleiharenicola sp. Vm1]|uniref:hypothetical protein n=1 Tax=Oleiharenicola sp. Vm1 TaxID=3398393 RepID=UPI0039F4B1DA
MSAAVDRALETVHAFLAQADALPAEPADVVLGLGHFDRAIPRLCAELALAGRARWIVFSGGVGAGSGDFPSRRRWSSATSCGVTGPRRRRASRCWRRVRPTPARTWRSPPRRWRRRDRTCGPAPACARRSP